MNRKLKKLSLSRETVRHLDAESLGRAAGGVTTVCGTAESACARCYTTDVTDCPGCVFSNNCISLNCPTGVGGC